MNAAAPQRRIRLCADDYGLSPGVNSGIRDLLARGRINATSVMMVGSAIDRAEADLLKAAAARNPGCAIGLHVTLTAPFVPLTMHYKPRDGGLFLPLPKMFRASLLRRLDPEIVRAEIAAQFAAFAALFGRPPDYADGHQHVTLFPQVRDAFLSAVRQAAPEAWVRQCGRSIPMGQRLRAPKALLLDGLSVTFRRRAARAGIAVNPAFAGAYDFMNRTDFAGLMAEFVAGMPDGGLVMCHPGFVDETLIALDPFTDQREREHAYLAGDDFPRLLERNGITLA